MKARDNVELDYYDQPNPRLIDLTLDTPAKEPRILDVGCWRGALGRHILSKSGASMEGIDINSTSLNEAQALSGYDRTYCLNLDRADFKEIEDQNYDVIVFGDVLEHTIEPAKIIQGLLPKLKASGHIVVSLPNIGFVWYRLQLLMGRWEYRDSGVMDRTHLRFFTYRSMRRFFEEFEPRLRIECTCPYIGIANRPRPLQWAMRGLARLWPNMFALQVIFKLRPAVRD